MAVLEIYLEILTNFFEILHPPLYVHECLLLSEVSLQLKILPKNIYKNKCREDEIDTIFNSPSLFTSNALIQFK